jgi:hypothetical protein
MAKASQKRAPVGSSDKKKFDGAKDPASAGKLAKLHAGGSTVPTFNASRIDALENKAPMKDKSAKH